MPIDLDQLDLDNTLSQIPDRFLPLLNRTVSGTYRNATPADGGSILELRVDVDGRRPQDRLSGDLYSHFSFCGIPITLYLASFVVEDLTRNDENNTIELSGPVIYYADPGNTGDSISVSIPRVKWFSPPAAACVRWYTNGQLVRAYTCPKISEYFRTATLEVDRFQGTVFPPSFDPDIAPSPSGIPDEVGITETFQRSGIDLHVVHDDTLNDADSDDVGSNWSEAELHDLMEDRFDSFADSLHWKLYGVVVPRFGDPSYNSGYYGTMFDFGGWQPGDTYLRQGCAIAEDAIRGREVDSLYDTSPKKDRLILQTMIHEIGHAFNLPHSWSRTDAADSASNSFMNYPWGYTGGGGTESDFWSDFRWEFDDVELIWMRHADRNDVIFGGKDWIGNNLSADLHPAMSGAEGLLELEIDAPEVIDFGVPLQLGLRLHNTGGGPVEVVDRLQPEDGLTRVVIQRPDGEIVSLVPPVRRLMAPPQPRALKPGETAVSRIALSYGAKGHQFAMPGEYVIRVYYPCWPLGFIATATHRVRVAQPVGRSGEELAHLLTSPAAAKFLYFGGSRRHPEVVDRLAEAAERYTDSAPEAARHISAALGRHAARAYKHVATKEEKRVVVTTQPDPDAAIAHLEQALTPLPREYGRNSAFRVAEEAALVESLVDAHVQMERPDRAAEILEEAIGRLAERGLDRRALERYKRRLRRLRPGKKAK